MSKGFEEAGRKIKAAIISSLMRYKGVDLVLKELPEDPGEYWSDLAESLMRSTQDELMKQFHGQRSDSDVIIQ